MGLIKVLDKDTINKIAAGEVVERPSSVVKELVENSIDAGATMITCEIKEGGKNYIRITDNGSGFNKDDITIAFLRHSTSKIKDENDLISIKSLGFRGEALSSISAIAKIELLSKKRDDFLGYRYIYEGGNEVSLEEAGCPDGTTIIVRELFYNTPARRKFLKSNMTEAGYINDLMVRLSISHPEIAFRFINQGKTLLFTNGNGNEKDAIYSIFGRETASNLIAINYSTDLLTISGYIGKPVLLKGNRSTENYYINGRYSKATVITKAIEEAYKEFSMNHQYPFTSLHFEFPLEKLDINVHPAKMEVRISDIDFYYAKIYQIIHEALKSSNMIVDAKLTNHTEKIKEKIEALSKAPQSFETNRIEKDKNVHSNIVPSWFSDEKLETVVSEQKTVFNEDSISNSNLNNVDNSKDISYLDIVEKSFTPSQYEQMSFMTKEEFVNDKQAINFKIVGQIFNTYWFAEKDNQLFIIDQHAAHEKILYERTMKKYHSRTMETQQLYPPIIVSLSLIEMDCYLKYKDYFERLGFEIESFGGRDFSINGVPTDLFSYSGDLFFHEILEQLLNSPIKGDIDLVIDKIASMSCKAAIKGNMKISSIEAESLIKELLNLENPYHCPHGRPVIIAFSKQEIEKKFKRIL